MSILDNQPFMILEWIAGEEGRGTDLRGWLRHGPLELKSTLEITIDLCRGLMHAQEKRPGLVHRDLKPENILMAQGGLAKITDFGLAQIVATTELEVAQEGAAANSHQSFVGGKGVAGTPAYMAPEQWRSERLDERTDIYALGIILYEMLSGASPFSVNFTPTTPQQWQTAHESDPYPKLPALFAPTLQELLADCLAKALSDRPASLLDLLTRLSELYQQHFDQSPLVRPAPGIFRAADYNNRGITYAALGQHSQALDDFGCALALDPNDVNAYSNRGNTYQASGQHAQALEDYGSALVLNPNLAQAYIGRGATYHALGQYTQALDAYDHALTLDPNLVETYHNRSNTYRALEQYTQALDDNSRALALDPNLAQAYIGRGTTYQALGQHVQALNDFGCALALDPNDAKAYSNRGNTYQTLGQHAPALDDYDCALALDPNYANAYYNRGTTYQALGQYMQALNDFDRAIALDPNNAIAYSNRGATYLALGQHTQALDDLGRALTFNPNDAIAYFNIGALLANNGQLREALSYFEKAAQLGHPQGAQYAAHFRHRLEFGPAPQMELAQQAFMAIQHADSVETMRQMMRRFPMLVQADFMAAIKQIITQQASPEQRPALEQRLVWLRQIADEQE